MLLLKTLIDQLLQVSRQFLVACDHCVELLVGSELSVVVYVHLDLIRGYLSLVIRSQHLNKFSRLHKVRLLRLLLLSRGRLRFNVVQNGILVLDHRFPITLYILVLKASPKHLACIGR